MPIELIFFLVASIYSVRLFDNQFSIESIVPLAFWIEKKAQEFVGLQDGEFHSFVESIE